MLHGGVFETCQWLHCATRRATVSIPRVAVKFTRSVEAVEGISSEVPSGKGTPSSINDQSDSAPSLDLAEAIDAHFRRESHQSSADDGSADGLLRMGSSAYISRVG